MNMTYQKSLELEQIISKDIALGISSKFEKTFYVQLQSSIKTSLNV
jgi:hypothetical protein